MGASLLLADERIVPIRIENLSSYGVMGKCDTSALALNVNLGRKHKLNGTPALIFEDGRHVPGAMSPEQVEKQLVASARKGG